MNNYTTQYIYVYLAGRRVKDSSKHKLCRVQLLIFPAVQYEDQ